MYINITEPDGKAKHIYIDIDDGFVRMMGESFTLMMDSHDADELGRMLRHKASQLKDHNKGERNEQRSS